MTVRDPAPQVVLVTGGNRGIGRAVAVRAAAAGWNVAFTYRAEPQTAFEAVSEIESGGGRAVAIRANVGSQPEVREAFAAVIDRFGRIDAVVNIASVFAEQLAIGDVDETRLLEAFRPNVFGVFYCAAEAVRRMSTQRGGRGGAIVNISSAAARDGGMPGESRCAAGKGAVDSLTVALAKELAPHGIRVNAVRAGTAAEVAAAIVFLMSGQSSDVHGAVLDASGER